jgi:hypothetical protein
MRSVGLKRILSLVLSIGGWLLSFALGAAQTPLTANAQAMKAMAADADPSFKIGPLPRPSATSG